VVTQTYDPKRYGKADRVNSHEHESAIREIAALSEAADLELPGLSEAVHAMANSKAIAKELRQRREDPKAAANRIAEALVDGKIDLKEAAADLAAVESMGHDSLLASAVRRTVGKLPVRGWAEFTRQLDEIDVIATAKEAAAEVREEIIKLRPLLKDIHSGEDATAAGTKTAAAWARYKTELLPRWHAIHKLVQRLRDRHLIPPLPEGYRRAGVFGRYDLMDRDAQTARRAGRPIRPVLDEACDTWQPTGPHTEAEAIRFCKEVDRANIATEVSEKERREAMRVVPGVQR
jgi:hypothetical protein